MEKILHALKTTMDIPQTFGTFHLVTLAAVVVFTAVLCVFLRNAKNKTYRGILLSVWAILFIMELLKQLCVAYYFDVDGNIVWAYDFKDFPLQLCSFPLYVLPFIALLKEGKVRDALSAFSYTYLLLGGVAVLFVPSTVFRATVFLNVQTMVHHGLQIVSCIYIAVYNRKRFTFRAFFSGVAVFVAAVLVATVFNVGLHAAYPDQRINMFYISPYFKKEMPILNEEWHSLHWAPTILLYVAGVSGFAFVIFLLWYLGALLIKTLSRKKTDSAT